MVHFHMRSETKPGERRTAVVPQDAEKLIKAGHKVSVERFADRCYPDSAYEAVGCTLEANDLWRKEGGVPENAVVLGLKELPEGDDSPLPHAHIMFAHCFKEQDGWDAVMSKFVRGGGKLYDLEFLKEVSGRRKVAFGRSAGFCGMGAGILSWAHQHQHNERMQQDAFPKGLFYPSKQGFINHAKQGIEFAGRQPRIMIIGAKGRCGSGAVEMATEAGVPLTNILQWDMEETSKGGPFPQILDVDIFVNCIYLDPTSTTPAFLTTDMLEKRTKLSVMVDVSCDPNNPRNPVPVYHEITTMQDPTKRILEPGLPEEGSKVKANVAVGVEGFGAVAKAGEEGVFKAGSVVLASGATFAYNRRQWAPVDGKALTLPFDVIAIDHLPSLVPSESSNDFSEGLTPMLIDFEKDSETVWKRALEVFDEKTEALAKAQAAAAGNKEAK